MTSTPAGRVTLQHPVGELAVINLRSPVLGDAIDLGSIRRLVVDDLAPRDGDMQGRVVEDPERFLRWAERLSGVAHDDLTNLSLRDASALRVEVLRLCYPFEVSVHCVK